MPRLFALPEITLDRSADTSLREQIHSQIASAIRHGAIPNGARLPSSRLMAKLLRVSRNTVVEAYEILLERGLIQAVAGSGMKVCHGASGSIPNFSNLRQTAAAAHYPVRTVPFKDPNGINLYLNVIR